MISQSFEYLAPDTLGRRCACSHPANARFWQAGMSLIPLMKLRLTAPAEVVDLGRVPGLNGIGESGGVVRIGALATHHDWKARL